MAAETAFRIRRYRPHDIESVMGVFYETAHSTCAADYAPAQLEAWAPRTPDRDSWKCRLESMRAIVAERTDDTALIGFASMDRPGHLDHLFVRPDQQRCGIASALLDMLEREARDGGASAMRTEASITAQPFFEHRGYRVLAKQRVKRHGVELVNFRMERIFEREKSMQAEPLAESETIQSV